MLKGYSEATLSVLKRGPGVYEQAQLILELGPAIAPKILHVDNNNNNNTYEMEMLYPLRTYSLDVIIRMYGLLRDFVWLRPTSYDGNLWMNKLHQWAELGDGAISRLIVRCYPEPESEYRKEQCMIHGDPTMANAMMRSPHELIITDPAPRTLTRMEIPNLREVDIGKLVQSAHGWEALQGAGEVEDQEEEFVDTVLKTDVEKSRAYLWAAIHLERLSRRATMKKDARVYAWAIKGRKRMMELCKWWT